MRTKIYCKIKNRANCSVFYLIQKVLLGSRLKVERTNASKTLCSSCLVIFILITLLYFVKALLFFLQQVLKVNVDLQSYSQVGLAHILLGLGLLLKRVHLLVGYILAVAFLHFRYCYLGSRVPFCLFLLEVYLKVLIRHLLHRSESVGMTWSSFPLYIYSSFWHKFAILATCDMSPTCFFYSYYIWNF